MRIFCQISIHALRVEGDSHKYITYTDLARISIHALRVEGDSRYLPSKLRTPTYFYPRPPGGGRLQLVSRSLGHNNFYPRPPGGGRHFTHCRQRHVTWYFYPRPPGGGRHLRSRFSFNVHRYFYPRPPGGGRLWAPGPGDNSSLDFYPRPPGGGRQQKQTKFSSVFAQKGEEFASLRRGKRKFAGGVLKRTNFGF